MKFEALNKSHAKQLLKFELENQAFFETVIAARGADFYTHTGISQHIDSMTIQHSNGIAFPFVLLENESIIARANIKNIQPGGIGEIGYRVSRNETGRGVGSVCVKHLICAAKTSHLAQLLAVVINNNPASEKVLMKNGFQLNVCLPNRFIHQGSLYHGFEYIRDLA